MSIVGSASRVFAPAAMSACLLAACLLAALPAGAPLATAAPAAATPSGACPGNPDALGTSRVITVDPAEHPRIGTMQYSETLPLADHEVVLTFDDGPLSHNSARALDILDAECVKVTYFLVGRMALANPEMVRRIQKSGHSIGTHSMNHPLTFHKMPPEKFEKEIEDGISSVAAALGGTEQMAPFFRIPGLLRAEKVETYLASRGLQVWSADFPADDWKHIPASEILKRAIERLEAKGRGVLLLHDIQPQTVIALPGLIKELKMRGYRIVHVQGVTPETPKTATDGAEWRIFARHGPWPRQIGSIGLARLDAAPRLPAPDLDNFAAMTLPGRDQMVAAPVDWLKQLRAQMAAANRPATVAHGPRKRPVAATEVEHAIYLPDLDLMRFFETKPKPVFAFAAKKASLGFGAAGAGAAGRGQAETTGSVTVARRGRPANAAFPAGQFP